MQQHYRQTYNNNTQQHTINGRNLQRNSSGKVLSYSPGHWKNYIASDLTRRPEESRSSYESGHRLSNPGSTLYLQQTGQTMPVTLTQREEKYRKKQQMLKRVRQIQERVMPLIENDSNFKVDEDISWKSKIQQKVAKLQTAADAIQKSLEIKLEKQVIDLEKRMLVKFTQLQARLSRPNQL